MRLVYGEDEAVARWVAARIPHVKDGFKLCRAIGIADGIGLMAGFVYTNYRSDCRDIEISCAADSPKWCVPGMLRVGFAYPFIQLDCNRVTCVVPRANRFKRVRRFLMRLGFHAEGTMRQLFDGEDAVIFGMLKSECRWIR
jgi:RimJ/RimL family protein N-acetyltransferase